MADTPRTLSNLLALYADNQTGAISAADFRDGVVSWHPEAASVHDVRTYGARGDGVTDDHAPIQAALDAIRSAGGGVLLVPSGTFIIGQPLVVSANTTVIGQGASSVIKAKPQTTCFNVLSSTNADNIRLREIVLDGNRQSTTDDGNDNHGCGYFADARNKGQIGLSVVGVVLRDHHSAGIRVLGPDNSTDPYKLLANELEIARCQIESCGRRGILLQRVTCAYISGNRVTGCAGPGIQLVIGRNAIVEGNTVSGSVHMPDSHNGHGLAMANFLDYALVNNIVAGNARWGIVASGGIGLWPPDHLMCQRLTVSGNVCRQNGVGGITIDPTTGDATVIQDSFATVTSNVCTGNVGEGIHTTHAGYLVIKGNICDANVGTGIAISSSSHAVVADNVLTKNTNYGLGFWVSATVQGSGHHLIGGNIFDANGAGEIHVATTCVNVRQLQDRLPTTNVGGMNIPVKITSTDPLNGSEGQLYLNTADNKLRIFADGAWRTLQDTPTGTSW